MRLLPLVSCLLILSLGPRRAEADSLTSVFSRANHACATGDYDAAIAGYERLIEAQVDDPDVTYNLATAHAKAAHYGQAVRYFQRTLRLSPGDETAEKNLERARQALGQQLANETGEATLATRAPLAEAMFARFRVDSLALALLVSVWLLTACLFSLQWIRGEAPRLGLGILAVLSVLTAFTSGFGMGVKTDWGATGVRALVIRDDVPLHDGPDASADSSLRLREGTPLRLHRREHGFVEAELPGQRRGYVAAADVGEI